MTKRWSSTNVLGLVLGVGLVAACGDDTSKQHAPDSDATVTSAPDTAAPDTDQRDTDQPDASAPDTSAADSDPPDTRPDLCASVVCTAPDDCHSAPTCEPTTGLCGAAAPLSDGSACDDHDPCTSRDTCSAGACTAGAATVCDDSDPCTADACDATSGCVATPASGAACDDGDACTDADVCADGVCAGAALRCCVAALPSEADVDQQQLARQLGGGGSDVAVSQPAVQSFTVGRSGRLVGMELALSSCGPTLADQGVDLTITRAGVAVASASLRTTELSDSDCTSTAVPSGAPDCGRYFDLRAAALDVVAGESLVAELTRSGPLGVCEAPGICTAGVLGRTCFTATSCDARVIVGRTAADSYAGGSSSSGGDLTFRTFVVAP